MNKRFSIQLIFIIILILLLAGCGRSLSSSFLITPSGKTIVVDLAITPEERKNGLMFKEFLEKNHGMLFIFPELQMLSFWMKNTLIPLDILYLDEHGTIIDILTMTPCPKEETRCPTYTSSQPVLYALEINAGEAKTLELQKGDRFEIKLPSYVIKAR